MNHIHRVIFNQALGTAQVVPEVAHARGSSTVQDETPGRAGAPAFRLSPTARLCAAAIVSLAVGGAWAAGGTGGATYSGAVAGGAGGTSAAGATGASGVVSSFPVGGGGGGGGTNLGTGIGSAGGRGGQTGALGGNGGARGDRVTLGASTHNATGSSGGNGQSVVIPSNPGWSDLGAGGGGSGGAGLAVDMFFGILATHTVTGKALGGNGGNGGNAGLNQNSWGGGGGGGEGGMGVLRTSGNVAIDVGASALGGNGGNGGQAGGGAGGSGGDGGAGIAWSGAGTGTLTNGGAIAGGSGGMGGKGAAGTGAQGLGGQGVVWAGSKGGTLTNDAGGSISGGAGRMGGDGVSRTGGGSSTLAIRNSGVISGGAGTAAGGAGISGSNLSVVNNGTIRGGRADGGTGAQANAVTFTGGKNTLQINTGSAIEGNVVAVAGGADQLVFGGAGSDSFDVGLIGSQYRNFAGLEKTDGGTWTLTGSSKAATPWTISGGTLVGHAAAFGSGSILNDATLVLDQAADVSMANTLGGDGRLVKTGAGALALTGNVALAGGAEVAAGMLRLGDAAITAGSITGTKGSSPLLGAGGNGGTAVTVEAGAAGAANFGTFTGGAGGNGGVVALTFGQRGGDGGTGLHNDAAQAAIDNAGTVAGGAGGRGGIAVLVSGRGGDGGTGLNSTAGGVTIRNSGAVQGGAGGAGGIGAVGVASGGGSGGTGMALAGSTVVVNSGSIAGGNGGPAGNTLIDLNTPAAGGVGIVASGDVRITNGGSISGGLAAGGGERADAIRFSGGGNRLELLNTSAITGNVVATAAGDDTLALTGSADGAFDASAIGAAAQYRHFTGFEKEGTSTWTLAGSTTAVTPWRVTGGALRIADDAALGDAGGALTLDGGTLQTTASTTSARALTLGAGGGTLHSDTATVHTVAGVIGGSGALVKDGGGTLVLAAANTYGGGTTIAAGTLQLGDGGTGGSITGDVANHGTLAFNRSDATTFAGTISGSGAVEQRGGGTTTLAAANGYTGGTRILNGTLAGHAASFGSGAIVNDAALVIDQGTAAGFANAMSGSGNFTKTGAGALDLTGDSSAFTGASRVAAGTLAVNGRLGGTLSVAGGATLKGNGTVGSTVVEGGALVAPGNSIGTLHVAGDLTLASGAAYQVEASPDGRSDQILVSGRATVQGASAIALLADGNWNPYGSYTILKADGGIAGQFGAVHSNFAFLTPTIEYGAQTASLTLMRNDVRFSDVGVTWNQKASAGAIEPLAATPLYRAVVQLDRSNALVAFDQLSGELHASVKSAAVEDSHLVRDTVLDRARQSLGGVGTAAAGATQLSEGSQGSVWARAYGGRTEAGGDGNAANSERSTSGLLIGADRRVGESARAGVFAGFGHTRLDAGQRRGEASGDAWHLGAYGGAQWGALGVRGGASLSRQSLTTQRTVAFTGVTDGLRASYALRTVQAFGEVGWRIDAGERTAFEPFASLAHVDVRSGSINEQGLGSGAALSGRGDSTKTTFATLGLRASTRASLGGVEATLRGSAGWRRVVDGDVTPSARLGLYGGLSQFTVLGTPLAREAFVLDAGVDLNLGRNMTLGVTYGTQFTGGTTYNGLKADMRWTF